MLSFTTTILLFVVFFFLFFPSFYTFYIQGRPPYALTNLTLLFFLNLVLAAFTSTPAFSPVSSLYSPFSLICTVSIFQLHMYSLHFCQDHSASSFLENKLTSCPSAVSSRGGPPPCLFHANWTSNIFSWMKWASESQNLAHTWYYIFWKNFSLRKHNYNCPLHFLATS